MPWRFGRRRVNGCKFRAWQLPCRCNTVSDWRKWTDCVQLSSFMALVPITNSSQVPVGLASNQSIGTDVQQKFSLRKIYPGSVWRLLTWCPKWLMSVPSHRWDFDDIWEGHCIKDEEQYRAASLWGQSCCHDDLPMGCRTKKSAGVQIATVRLLKAKTTNFFQDVSCMDKYRVFQLWFAKEFRSAS